jgi:putative tricarboxylic transport membrane protein
MALLETITAVVSLLLTPQALFIIIGGTVLGLVFGVIPGLGALVALALLLPFTFNMQPEFAFLLLTAALGGSNFGGSITSILLNTPGTPTNVATLIDGYPLAKQGRADEAIGASATASALGAIFGIIILVTALPFMIQFMLLFGPPEIFWLGVLAIAVVSTVTGDDLILGIISGVLGLFLSFVGFNAVTGSARLTFGTTYLYDGIPLVPALVGLFAFAEMVRLSAKDQITDKATYEIGKNKWAGVMAVFKHRWLFIRSAVLGVTIGIIPGVGGTSANYLAYYQAVQTSSDNDTFGNGDIRGVIGAEAANDAKDGGSFIPTLGLGIPGSASMAIFIGAFLFHGMTPGPLLFKNNMSVIVTIIFGLLISNVLTSTLGLITAGQLAKLTQVRTSYLIPVVASLALMGAYVIRSNPLDMILAVGFGILGLLMVKVKMTRVPLILGIILGGIIENNLQRTFQLGGVNALYASPLSKILIVAVIIAVGLPAVQQALSDSQRSIEEHL